MLRNGKSSKSLKQSVMINCPNRSMQYVQYIVQVVETIYSKSL